VVLAGLLVSAPVWGDNCIDAKDMFQQGLTVNKGQSVCDEECLKQKEYFYQKAIALCPDYPEAYNNLGDIYENMGKYKEALGHYQKAIRLASNFAIPYYGSGDIYFKNGQYNEAITYYKKGIEFDSEESESKKTSKVRILQAQDFLHKGQIAAPTIIAILKPPVERGLGGVRETKSPQISFGEHAIPFDFNSAVLRDDAFPQLQELGKALSSKELAGDFFEVSGHTDMRGTAEYNHDLSVRRAEAVKKYLTAKYSISADHLLVKGYGKSNPLAYGGDDASYALNRRVVIRKLDIAERTNKQSAQISMDVGFMYKSRQSEKIEQLLDGRKLTVDDNYKIYFKPLQTCYVYVIQQDAHHKTNILYNSPKPVEAHKDYWLPEYGKWFYLDQNKGKETIYVLASLNRAEDVEYLLTRTNTAARQEEKKSAMKEVVYLVKSRSRSVDSAGPIIKKPALDPSLPNNYEFQPQQLAGKGGFYKSINFIHD